MGIEEIHVLDMITFTFVLVDTDINRQSLLHTHNLTKITENSNSIAEELKPTV